jgi:hypothetical protein
MIWSANGFFIIGEWKHNSEEVSVSCAFETSKQAEDHLRALLGMGWVYRHPDARVEKQIKGEMIY